ncbi:hypothetical protein Tco_1230734 [Tanacetum coccineum]
MANESDASISASQTQRVAAERTVRRVRWVVTETIEGLTFGRVLIFFPVMNDKGLNVMLLRRKKLGVEIPINEKDRSFTNEAVAESIKLAMVSKEWEHLRTNVRKMKGLFRDKNKG